MSRRAPVVILGLPGSLRHASLNLAALQAARRLSPADIEIHVFEGLGELPHFNPDLDNDHPADSVARLRAMVGGSDGLLIACPEYAHGVPGTFKNALDWLVSSAEFPGKPVALINTSPWSGHAQAALREILATMSATLVGDTAIELALPGHGCSADDICRDPALSAVLRGRIVEFAAIIRHRSHPAASTA